MGIPTIPNYIITSAVAGPALYELGIPLIVSHMFVFYFGILADLTPPVALACFAAAPIAKESGFKIQFKRCGCNRWLLNSLYGSLQSDLNAAKLSRPKFNYILIVFHLYLSKSDSGNPFSWSYGNWLFEKRS